MRWHASYACGASRRALRGPACAEPGVLLEAVAGEASRCRDVARLRAAAACLCHLAAGGGVVGRGALAALLGLLGSRLPRVRLTGDQGSSPQAPLSHTSQYIHALRNKRHRPCYAGGSPPGQARGARGCWARSARFACRGAQTLCSQAPRPLSVERRAAVGRAGARAPTGAPRAQARADAAEALYMQLLAAEPDEAPGADLPAALDLLAATAWDGPAAAALAARDALYAPLGLPAPAAAAEADGPPRGKAGGGAGGALLVTCVADDEGASYAALLADAQRGM